MSGSSLWDSKRLLKRLGILPFIVGAVWKISGINLNG